MTHLQDEFFLDPTQGDERLDRLLATAPKESSGELADGWARGVVAGTIVANSKIVAACGRYLAMRDDPDPHGVWWDVDRVDRARDFARMCGHGIEDQAGEPLDWLPWQCCVAMVLLGCRRLDAAGARTEFPKFKSVLLVIAKGAGKSEFAASLVMGGMEDASKRFKFACTAPDGRLAQVVFERMQTMTGTLNQCGAMPYWVATGGTSIATPGKVRHGNCSFTTLPCSDKALDGRIDRLVVADEVSRMLKGLGRLLTGLSKNPYSQFAGITTPDSGQRNAPIWPYWEACEKALASGGDLPLGWFAFIFGLDVEDSGLDPKVWGKANPSLGVTVQAHDVEMQVRTMLLSGNPKQIAECETQILCRYHEVSTANLDLSILERQAVPQDWDRLRGLPMFVGLDLSRGGYGPQIDLTSLECIVEDGDKLRGRGIHWWAGMDIDTDSRRSDCPLQDWIHAGHLRRMPGEWQDMEIVEAELENLMRDFRVVKIGVDPHASQVKAVERWIARGWPVVTVDQSIRTMAPAYKIWADLYKSRVLTHEPCPVLKKALMQATFIQDNVGNVRPVKGRSQGNIDALVAANMAALLTEHHGNRNNVGLEHSRCPI